MVGVAEVNGLWVHTGVLGKENDPDFLDRQGRHTVEITDIGFYRRTPDGEAKEVTYNPWHIARKRQYLGVRVKRQTGDEATLFTTGTYNVRDLFGDLGITPLDLSQAIGRQVDAYGDTTVWGLWIPKE